MKVAIYARVSTEDKEQDPERQRMKCQQYCELHNHTVVNYQHDKTTGSSNPFERQGFSEMMKSKPEGIVIYEISRFSREHPAKVMRRLSELKNQGIKIISITEPAFNMEGDMSDLLQYIMTWFNNYYLTNLKRNVKSGIERARAQGKILGRPKAKFNEYRAFQLLINEKKSLADVSKELDVSKATLHRFKKVAENNPSLFINESNNSKSPVFETDDEENDIINKSKKG